MEPLFSELYKDGMSSTIKTRLSNAYLIGEIFGMLFFGYVIDKIGRRTGIFFASKFLPEIHDAVTGVFKLPDRTIQPFSANNSAAFFLVLGVVLATAAHGTSQLGMFWMMIVARGVAGFGAGGKSNTARRYLPADSV